MGLSANTATQSRLLSHHESQITESQEEFIWERVVDILYDISLGLSYIHGKGFVHRDLKPRNGTSNFKPPLKHYTVLYSGRDQCWKLADFGSAASATSKNLVTSNQGRGTPSYRAPELLTTGRFNTRSDLFALGCISYELVSGHKLFLNDLAVLEYFQKQSPVFPDKWPPNHGRILLRQLAKLTSTLLSVNPKSRPGTAATILQLRFIRFGIKESGTDPTNGDDGLEVKIDDVIQLSSTVPVPRPSLQITPSRKKRSPSLPPVDSEGGDNQPKRHCQRRFLPRRAKSTSQSLSTSGLFFSSRDDKNSG